MLHKIAVDLGFSISTAPRRLEVEGKNILMLHCPDELDALAQSKKYDLIVYGHTHQIDLRKKKNFLIFNPGEAGGWLTNKYTIGIVELPSLEARIIEL